MIAAAGRKHPLDRLSFIEAAVEKIGVRASDLLCWLGPAIGPDAFDVGPEVRARFLELGGEDTEAAFRPSTDGKWLANLYALATERLNVLGVDRVWGGDLCMYSDPTRFFSYRRDGVTGRMASLIWILSNLFSDNRVGGEHGASSVRSRDEGGHYERGGVPARDPGVAEALRPAEHRRNVGRSHRRGVVGRRALPAQQHWR